MLVDSDFRAEPGGGLSDRRRTGAGSGSPAKAAEHCRSPRRFAQSRPKKGASFWTAPVLWRSSLPARTESSSYPGLLTAASLGSNHTRIVGRPRSHRPAPATHQPRRHRRRPRRYRDLHGRPPARRPNLHRPAGPLAQQTLDAMLRRQSLDLHRHRPDQRHPILISNQRHGAAGPSAWSDPATKRAT